MIKGLAAETVEEELSKQGLSVDQTDGTKWLIQSGDDTFEARLNDDRILFQAYLSSAWDRLTAQPLYEFAQINAWLPGNSRVCIDPRDHRPMLLADAPLNTNDLARTLNVLCDDFTFAGLFVEEFQDLDSRNFDEHLDAELTKLPAELTKLPADSARWLADELRDLGWAVAPRDNGELIIEWKFADAYYPVRIAQSDSEVHLTASLPELAHPSLTTRQAIALFLLQASHRVLGVKASASSKTGSFRWHRGWHELPEVDELHDGLTAMTIALQMTSPEVLALSHETTAKAFLNSRAAQTPITFSPQLLS